MKKLMITLAAVAMAVATQAASINWQVTTGAADTYLGTMIYLCSAGSDFESSADVMAALVGTTGNSGEVAKKGSSMSGYWYGTSGTAAGLDDSLVKKGATVYAVILSDDGKGYWSVAGTGDIYTTDTTPTKAIIDVSSKLAGAYTPWAGGPGPDPTPEPTTGLLMLVGLAGLALKRKVA